MAAICMEVLAVRITQLDVVTCMEVAQVMLVSYRPRLQADLQALASLAQIALLQRTLLLIFPHFINAAQRHV